MKELRVKMSSSNSKRFLSFLAISILFAGVFIAGVSCVQGTGDQSSDDPINTGIIAFLFNPDVIFGNGSSGTEIQTTTEIFPDGSAINFKITGSSLPQALRGCLFDADTVLSNGGQAFVDYVGGINIASSSELLSEEPPVEGVNIAATVTPPGGDTETDFGSVLLNPVGMIPPEGTALESGALGDPSTFLRLTFDTIGLPPGTIVDFTLSNPAIGTLSPMSDAVVGSEDSGSVTTQYTSINETGGAQVVTATAILDNPSDINPNCPDVPEGQRRVQETVFIDQSVPDDDGGVAEAACDDAADNDGDGDTDCADADCDGQACAVGMICVAGACS